MFTMVLDGIPVQFPYEPNGIQQEYMASVIKCLKQEKVGFLESPTGTGKTIALLCATLAWMRAGGSDMGPPTLEQTDTDFIVKQEEKRPVRLIYASHTHSQLKEAVREFKSSAYSDTPMTILGSRKQMCVNSAVVKLDENSLMKCACEYYTSGKARVVHQNGSVEVKKCSYFEHMDRLDTNFFSEPMDIEDLVTKCTFVGACPYFAAHLQTEQASVIFTPYDYVLESAFAKNKYNKNITYDGNQMDLQGSVLIFDEGHNIESKFEEFASASLNVQDIQLCVESIQHLIQISEIEVNKSTYEGVLKEMETLLDVVLKTFLDHSKPVGFHYCFSTEEMELFLKSILLCKCEGFVGKRLEDEFVKPSKENIHTHTSLNRIIKFFDHVSVFSHHNDCFRLIIEEKVIEEPDSPCRKIRTIEFWCLDPSFTMARVEESGVHSIIITSGTLAPISTLMALLKVQPGGVVEHTNGHITENYQVMARIVTCGPDGVYLNSSYHRRQDKDYLTSLGVSILKIATIIKHKGVIIFFSSYDMISSCKKHWQEASGNNNPSLWSQLCTLKEIYEEPKSNKDFDVIMGNFKSCIKEKRSEGSLLLAVFRGKVAEGLDLKDDYGRVVILTGIPYRPREEPRLKLKMSYLQTNKIDAERWYVEDAMRAANQAMGRVIRHKKDYGVILMLDYRFKLVDVISWLRESVSIESRFCELMQHIEQFMKDVEERVLASHAEGACAMQQFPGNVHPWEKRQVERELKKMKRMNSNLQKQVDYFTGRIKELVKEEDLLKRKLEERKEQNEERLSKAAEAANSERPDAAMLLETVNSVREMLLEEAPEAASSAQLSPRHLSPSSSRSGAPLKKRPYPKSPS